MITVILIYNFILSLKVVYKLNKVSKKPKDDISY